jgi:predicted Zn-dependent protease with MMP-like domain
LHYHKRRSDERAGKIEISVERFKTLVEALEALPEDIKGDSANMVIRGLTSLISNVANDLIDCTHLSGGLLSRHGLTRLRGFYRTLWKS